MSPILRLGPPFDPVLLDALEALIREWEGEAWRVVFEGSIPLTPNVRGARWSPPGTEALYCSLDLRTAHAEIDYLISRQPVPIQLGRETYVLRLRLGRVLDLSDCESLKDFDLDESVIKGENWGHTQALGYAAYHFLECSGLLVPSARFPATNLVVFPSKTGERDEIGDLHAVPTGPVEVV